MRPSLNPKVAELTKSHRERSFTLGDLAAIKVEGIRYCAWCAVTELTNFRAKYCSSACSVSAMAWAYPQKEESLGMLLINQNFKCAHCAFDYGTIVEEMLKLPKIPYGLSEVDPKNFRQNYNFWLVKRLKRHCHKSDRPHRLEVDHIEPIHRGGRPLARENLQLICYTCHKKKTKLDNSGKRGPGKTKNKTKQDLLAELDQVKDENDALRSVNGMLQENIEFLQELYNQHK